MYWRWQFEGSHTLTAFLLFVSVDGVHLFSCTSRKIPPPPPPFSPPPFKFVCFCKCYEQFISCLCRSQLLAHFCFLQLIDACILHICAERDAWCNGYYVCSPSLPPMLLGGFESGLGLESSSFSMWHFLKLSARGFLRVHRFPPLLHRLIVQPIK